MAKPTGVLWDRGEHTAAKHKILRRYLDAWLPIMSRQAPRLILIDGFAGPGRYIGGEDGSPIIMLKSFLEHRDRATIERAELVFFFVESHAGRAHHLEQEVDRLRPLPPNASAYVIHGEFADVMERALEGANSLAPSFAFLDPFGFEGNKLTLTSRILGFPKCEALIYFPTPFLVRFVGHKDTEGAFATLYGGRQWEAAIPLRGEERRQMLHDLFQNALGEHASYVRSFEIVSADNNGYHLFFASSHRLGLEKMKEAMWSVDPQGGVRFRDSTARDQLVLFEAEPDYSALREALRLRFAGNPFSLAQAEDFTLFSTAFVPSRHLKRATLLAAEKDRELEIRRPAGARKGTVPDRAVMRFVARP